MRGNGRSVSCIDLFCGAGGLTHGFVREGLRVEAGVDLDPACRHPFSANNDALFVERDLTAMDPSELGGLFAPGAVRVLAGCAPCQPFSTYSHRYDTRSDQKWRLLMEFERMVRGIVPDVVTMENVPALRKHEVFGRFVATLERLGYEVWHDEVQCADYGVPQNRKRLVLLASLHGPLRLIDPLIPKDRYRTVADAIRGLRPIRAGEADPEDELHVASRLSETNLARIRASRPGGTWRDWPPHLVADCHRRASGRTYPSVYGRMEWDKPAPTITTQCYGFGNGRFGHPEQDRAISLREAALLQGFPKEYEFLPPGQKVCFKTLGRLIGNAVPVDLGRAIARSILLHLDAHDPRTRAPNDTRSLSIRTGDESDHGSSNGGRGRSGGSDPKKRGGPVPSSETASRRMSATGQRDTPPELEIRKRLFARGLRYRVDHPVLTKPRRRGDIVFPGLKIVVFVDGCFWHGCPIHGTWPKANADFWRKKIETNRARDADTDRRLRAKGWLVIRVWEHEPPDEVEERIVEAVERRRMASGGSRRSRTKGG